MLRYVPDKICKFGYVNSVMNVTLRYVHDKTGNFVNCDLCKFTYEGYQHYVRHTTLH